VAECGVLLLPGDVYGEPGHVRVGFGRSTTREAVERLDAWLTAG
jgi:aspartate/methionine/tyrosine aminotransferase